MDKLTIGRMAKLNNISEQTLRLYDKMGLLHPDTVNEENQYRYYSMKQSARLDMIQYMKALGMPLKDIKDQLDKADLSVIRSILNRRLCQIEDQMQELVHQKKAVERTLESYDRYETSPPDGSILMEFIPKRYIYSTDIGINFYEYDIEVYEKILRQLKQQLQDDNIPQVYFCNAGTIMPRNNLLHRHFVSTEFFIFLDENHLPGKNLKTIPAGTYLCTYCNKFDKELEYIHRLLQTIEEKGYTIAGDYLCEVVTDLPVFENNERGMFLRLQIPIEFSAKQPLTL